MTCICIGFRPLTLGDIFIVRQRNGVRQHKGVFSSPNFRGYFYGLCLV